MLATPLPTPENAPDLIRNVDIIKKYSKNNFDYESVPVEIQLWIQFSILVHDYIIPLKKTDLI